MCVVYNLSKEVIDMGVLDMGALIFLPVGRQVSPEKVV